MKAFDNTLIHITSDRVSGMLDVLFTYDFDADSVLIESVQGDYEVLENQDLTRVIRYAMLNERYNEYVYGTGNFEIINYSIEDYFQTTKINRDEDVLQEESPRITNFIKKLSKKKPITRK